MKNYNKATFAILSLLSILSMQLFNSCGPSVQLTSSWNNNSVQSAPFSRILVMAIGKDLEKRRMGEDNIKGCSKNYFFQFNFH